MIPFFLTALGGFLIGGSVKQYGRGGKLPAKVKRFVELQDEVNRQIDEKGEAEYELTEELNRIGDSLNSYESELAIEEYMKRREPVKMMTNGGEIDKMQLNVGYNYAVDRNVNASGTFEQFKEDFKKKVPKSAKFSEQVMKAIYHSLQQDWGKMANGGVLKKVRKYHADGLLEITRSGILGNDFKSTDGRFKAKQLEKSFIKDGIKRSRYEVTIDGQPVEGYHALEDAYLLAINYLDKMASGGNIEAINFSLKQYAKGGVVKNLSSSGAARWAELENLLKDKINEKGGGQIKAKIITKKGNDTIERFALASGGMSVLRMMKGKKRFGQLLTYVISDINDVEGVQFYDESESSYADDLEKKQKYILKNIHPNLWSDLKNEYSFSSDKLERFRNASQGLSHYESYKLAGQYDLPQIEQHKTITMQSAGMPEYAQRELTKAIEEKRDYRYSWDCGYDCSVSTKMGDDGIYRGWFSQEFRGTGNGYYWLLISPTQAIFVERD